MGTQTTQDRFWKKALNQFRGIVWSVQDLLSKRRCPQHTATVLLHDMQKIKEGSETLAPFLLNTLYSQVFVFIKRASSLHSCYRSSPKPYSGSKEEDLGWVRGYLEAAFILLHVLNGIPRELLNPNWSPGHTLRKSLDRFELENEAFCNELEHWGVLKEISRLQNSLHRVSR